MTMLPVTIEDMPPVRSALEVADNDNINADRVARAVGISRSLGLPQSVVLADLEYAQREEIARRIEQNDVFAQWAARNESNAALARDDVEGLGAVFDHVSRFGADILHGIVFDTPKVIENIGASLTHGAGDFNKALAGTVLAASENILGSESLPAVWSREALRWVEKRRPEEVRADGFWGQLGYDFVRSIPQQTGNILGAIVSPQAALAMLGVQIGGGDYARLREKGVSPARAAGAALLDASVQAPMERFSLGKLLDIFKSKGVADAVKRAAGSMGTEFITEWAQKAPELVTGLWAEAETQGTTLAEQVSWFGKTLFNMDTLLQANREGMYEGLIGALWGGLGGGVRVAASISEARKMKAFSQGHISLHETIEASKTKNISPDHMQDALESASPVMRETVHLPADEVIKLAQKGMDLLSPLGITSEEAAKAAKLGLPLEVSLSQLHARLDAPQFEAAADIMRRHPGGMNAAEAAILDAAAQSETILRQTRASKHINDAVRAETERLKREMTDLVGKHVAEQYAALHAANARAMANAYGIDPAELLRQRGIIREKPDVAVDPEARVEQTPDDGSKTSRAEAILSPMKKLIKVFGKLADLSSIPHESAHIFLYDLMRIAADTGALALNALQKSLEASGIQDAFFSDILAGRVDKNGAQARLVELRQEIAMQQAYLNGLKAAVKAAGKSKKNSEMREEARAPQEEAAASVRELEIRENLLAQYVRHLDGVERARADIALLRLWAGVPETGPLSEEQYVAFQEYVARAFEQYLYEGIAPSSGLRAVFFRMKQWLKGLYADWRKYVGLELNDDVRRVFDRMLATDAAMRGNDILDAAFALENDFDADLSLTEKERSTLEELRTQAMAEAQAAMDKAALRERNRRYREAYAVALEDLKASPFWDMIRKLEHREIYPNDAISYGGINKDSLVQYLGPEHAAEIGKKRPKIINAHGNGMPLDLVAMEQGFEDADAFANMLYDRLIVNGETLHGEARKMAEARLADDDAVAGVEDGMLAGEAYGKYLDTMESILERLSRPVTEQGAARRERRVPRSYYVQRAKEEMASTPLRQIRPDIYAAALRKALEGRNMALLAKKPLEAVKAVQRARMAYELAVEARRVRQEASAVERRASRVARIKPGVLPPVQTEGIRQICADFGLARVSEPRDAALGNETLRQLAAQSIEDADSVDVLPSFPDWLLDGADPNTGHSMGEHVSWRDLTAEQLQDVDNLLRFFEHTGRNQSRANKDSLAARVASVAEEAAAAMSSLPGMGMAEEGTARNRIQSVLQRIFASTDALRWQMKKADGFQDTLSPGSRKGAMERNVFDKIIDAEGRARIRMNNIHQELAPHLTGLMESVRSWEKSYGKRLNLRDSQGRALPVPQSIRQAYSRSSWSADMVISLALNMGNMGNRERIRSGYPDLTYDTAAYILGDEIAAQLFEGTTLPAGPRREGLLSLSDWRHIQGIWDILGSQWADTQAAHEKLYGFKPRGIEPQPLTLTTGEEPIVLPGGYYPIKYDGRLSPVARAREEQQDILDRSETLFPTPTAKKGHTQERAKSTGLPVKLSTTVLQGHINDVVRFIELSDVVRFADKVTRNPQFVNEYIRAFGQHDYDAIRPNLKGLVRDEAPSNEPLVTFADRLRKYVTVFGLSGNIKVALLQLTALFPAMGDIGARHVLRGMGALGTQGMGLVRQIWEASPYMRSRVKNIDQDLIMGAAGFNPANRPQRIIIGGKEITWEDAVNAGMMPLIAMDTVATTSVWMGAYGKKLAELQDGPVSRDIDPSSRYHAEAVAYADGIVKQSNPDYDASSRSHLLRSKGVSRLFSVFASAITLFAQRSRYMWQASARQKITKAHLARFEFFENILPATAVFMGLALARGLFGDDDDDDKKIVDLAVSTLAGQYGMKLPYFGSLITDALQKATGYGEGGRRGAEMSTVLSTPLSLFWRVTTKTGKSLFGEEMTEEQKEALAYSWADIASFALRLPVSRTLRNADRGWEQWERGEGTPLSLVLPRPGK